MSDPLSITASIITLIHVSVQVTVLISQFCNEASAVDTTLAGLLGDVEGFKRVLESMKETINQNDIKSNLQSTGHTGSHWKNLARSLNDGTDTLKKLHDLLDSVNKKTSLLDTQRKLIRLKSASGQIAQYREQIQSSHTALQLSLSTIILWNQVTFQRSTEEIPDKIVPTLDKLYDEFRSFGALLNAKIEKLQVVVVDPNDPDDYNLQYMTNLRECVRSAADVVSTASTNFNVDSNDKAPGRCGSDFGDIFIKDANEPMLRWFASNTVYEYEDVEAPIPAPPDASTGDALIEYHSDTDSDIENDMIRSLFKEGKRRQGQGDLTGAVRRFQNCLTRFSSNASYASLTTAQILTVCGVSKVELLENITDCYRALGLWAEAKAIMEVKLQITEHQVGKKDALYLKDTMKLAEIMMKNQDYVDAHLQARRSLRGFKKLGEQGGTDYESCLELLVKICQLEGKEDEEEAYAALLSGHAKDVHRSTPKSQPAELDPDIIQQQLPSALALQVEPNIAISTTKQNDKTIPQSHKPVEENLPHAETEIVAFGGEDDQLHHPKKRVEAPLPHVKSHSPETRLMEAKDDKSKKLNQQSSSFSEIQPPTLDTTEDLERVGSIAPLENYEKRPSPYGSVYNFGSFDTLPDPHNPGYIERDWRDVSTSGENSPIRHDLSDSSMRDERTTSHGFIGKLLAKSYTAFRGNRAPRLTVASSSRPFLSGRKPNTNTPPVVPDTYPYFASSIQSWASSIPLHSASDGGSIHSVSPSSEGWDAYPRASTTPGGRNPPAYLNRTHCPICHIYLSNMTLDAARLHEHCCVERTYGAVDLPRQNQEQQNPDQESLMHDSPILSALSAPADPIRRKILLVGDTGCAIACLAGAWTSSKHSNPFPAASVTPEVRKKAINIKGRQIDLDVWEIKPTHLLGRLLPHSPTTTHMLLICVATNRPSQFRNTALMWSAEAREHLPGVPTILVGCRKYPSPIKTKSEYERWMKLQNLALLSSRDGDSMAASIDALAYFEISSIESQVSSDLFDFVGEYMLRHTTE